MPAITKHPEMHVVRVIAKVEPGGAQLGALRLSGALESRGIATRLLVGKADPAGLRLLRDSGLAFELFGQTGGDLQYACDRAFADWLRPRLVGADLVHAHMFGGWWAASEAIAPAVPLVASEHNALSWPGRPRLSEMRRALARVDAFFAHGPACRATALELGLPPARLLGANSAIEAPVPRSLGDLPLPRLVYAGRMHAEKGPDLLLEALARLPEPVPAYLLGDGPLLPSLRSRAQRLGLGESAVFAGWRPHVGPWLAGASACVVPSRAEAWSQTAVTAMAHRVPVVATAVEGLPLTLADRRGLLVPPDDPEALAAGIAAVLEGRAKLDLDGARRYAARFVPERVAARYASVYRRLRKVGSHLSAAA